MVAGAASSAPPASTARLVMVMVSSLSIYYLLLFASSSPLVSAKAGIQGRELGRLLPWIPACAGMSGRWAMRSLGLCAGASAYPVDQGCRVGALPAPRHVLVGTDQRE